MADPTRLDLMEELIAALRAKVEAHSALLVAHRLGSHTKAARAIDKERAADARLERAEAALAEAPPVRCVEVEIDTHGTRVDNRNDRSVEAFEVWTVGEWSGLHPDDTEGTRALLVLPGRS